MATISTLSALVAPVAAAAAVELKDLLSSVEALGNAAHGDPGEPRQDLATLAVAMGVSPKGKAPKDLAQRIAKAMRGMEQEALSDALSQLPKHLQELLGVEMEESETPSEGFDRLEREAEQFNDSISGMDHQEAESERTQELPVLESEPVTKALAFVPQNKEYPAVGQAWGRALVEQRIKELGITVSEDRIVAYAEAVNAEELLLRRLTKELEEMDPLPAFAQEAYVAYNKAEAEATAWDLAVEEQVKTKAERDAVIAEERARRDAEKVKAEAETFPKTSTTSWGKVTVNTPTSGTIQMTDMKHPVGITGEAGFEKPILEMDAQQALAFVAKTREKVAMSGRESSLRRMVQSIKDQTKGGSVRQQRLPAMFDQELALTTGVLFNAINTGDRKVAEGAVYKLLSVAAMEFGGAALIDSATVKRIALEWGVSVPSKKGVPTPEQKKSESVKPAGNSPAPVVNNKPASEPAKAPVEAQKELPVSNTQQQSAPVSAPATEAVQEPVVQATPPVVEAPVAPASEGVKAEAPANEPEAPKAEAPVEAPTEPVVEQKQPASMADCWKMLVGMTPAQRNATLEMVMTTAEGQLKDKKLVPHLRTLVGKIKVLISKGKDFAAAKQAVKNANKNLLAWITSEYAAHSQEINGLLIKAIETGLQAQEPVGNSPDSANVDEPANTPASEENDMSSSQRINMHNANAVSKTVLEGTVEVEPTKEAPKVELSKEEKAAKAKADKAAKKEAAKAKKASTPKVMSTVKVGMMAADISVRRFCAPMIPAQKETVKALLNELKAACGESDALVSDVGTGVIPETLRTLMAQLVETHALAKAEHFGPVVSFEASATTDDQKRLAAKLRNDANAEWMAHMSDMAAKKMEELLKLAFAGPEGLAKKQALHAAMNYFLGRNETVQKDGRFVTKAGTEALAALAKDFQGELDAMKAETAEEKTEKARLAKGLSIFASVKDDKSYRALRVKLANAKAALARATAAELKDEPMIAKLQGQVAGLEKIGMVVDAALTGTAELHTWDLYMSGTTASRDMGLLIEAVLNIKFSSVIEADGKKETRIDGIAGSSEELRGTVGKLAAAMLIREVYQDVQLDLEVREVMEAIKSPKLLVQAAAKPGFRGYARTTAWAIYAGGVYVTLKTAAILNWAAAPLKAAYYAAKAAGLYGFGFVAEDKEGNRKAVSEALADAKDLIIGFFVLPKDMIVNGAKAGWAKVKSLFGGEKKADVAATDATKTETPDQGKKEGVMNTISEKSKSVITYAKEHKLETAGVVAGAVAGGVAASMLGGGALVVAGAVVAGAAVVAGGIWAVKKIAGWFSGRKAEAKAETAKVAQSASAKCDKPETKAGEPAVAANGCGNAPVAASASL